MIYEEISTGTLAMFISVYGAFAEISGISAR
jgi:hypothetical protein